MASAQGTPIAANLVLMPSMCRWRAPAHCACFPAVVRNEDGTVTQNTVLVDFIVISTAGLPRFVQFALQELRNFWQSLCWHCGICYFFRACWMTCSGSVPSAEQIFSSVSRVGLFSPRSRMLMYERSTPARSANSSWEMPSSSRLARRTAPTDTFWSFRTGAHRSRARATCPLTIVRRWFRCSGSRQQILL